jgi:hypothetical protein
MGKGADNNPDDVSRVELFSGLLMVDWLVIWGVAQAAGLLFDRFVQVVASRGDATNPEGIVTISPGLRGTSYPGKHRANRINPERVTAFSRQ